MAKTIRVSKNMRIIIDFFKKEKFGNFNEVNLSDGAICDIIIHEWLYQNYTRREADEILDSLY